MSKASAALRRSGVRLRSLGSGHTHLKLLMSEQSSARQCYKALLATQVSSSDCLDRWSQAEENPAIQDIVHQGHDLNLMWVESQREFVGALKQYKQVFGNILSVEKKLDIARKHLSACEEKEKKLKKEVVKGPKDATFTQEKLRQASNSVQLADAEVTGQKKETEALKLMAVRAGILDLSNSWEALGNKCILLAQSQKELAQLLPDVGSSRIQEVPAYNGGRESTRIVFDTRTKLDQVEMPASASASTSLRRYSDLDTSLTRRNFEMLATLERQEAMVDDDSFDDDSYDSN